MAALPGSEWSKAPPETLNPIVTVRHVFTHFSLDLHVVPCAEPMGQGWWQPLERLDDAGLPSLYRKAIAAARAF